MPSPGEGFGLWIRTYYEIGNDPSHGLVIRPATNFKSLPVILYRPPLTADDEIEPEHHPAIELLNILKGGPKWQLPEDPAEVFAHWQRCGTCEGCRKVNERALAFANRWGLLGLWKLPTLGYRDLDRDRRSFGPKPDHLMGRQEPLRLFLRAAAVFDRHLKELEDEENHDGDADFDGGVAEAFARALAEPGTEEFRVMRELHVEDPTLLRPWHEDVSIHYKERALQKSDARKEEKELTERPNEVVVGSFVGTIERTTITMDDPNTKEYNRAALCRTALVSYQGKARSNWGYYLPFFVARDPDPNSPGGEVPSLRWDFEPDALAGSGLNQLLRDVGMCVTRRGGRLALYYTFPTLWHALHIQLALWIARDRQALGVCADPHCRRAYLKGRSRGQPRKYCSDQCRVNVSKRRKKKQNAKRPN